MSGSGGWEGLVELTDFRGGGGRGTIGGPGGKEGRLSPAPCLSLEAIRGGGWGARGTRSGLRTRVKRVLNLQRSGACCSPQKPPQLSSTKLNSTQNCIGRDCQPTVEEKKQEKERLTFRAPFTATICAIVRIVRDDRLSGPRLFPALT